jgi:hypothetical protein
VNAFTRRLNVDQERDLLEGDERDAQGQNDVQQNEIGGEDIIDRAINEVGILEDAKEVDVKQDAEQQHRLRQAGLVAPLAQPKQERRQ